MNIIILGYGSIGKRHHHNLKRLIPDAGVFVADPYCKAPGEDAGVTAFSRDWRKAVREWLVDAALVCSPADIHAANMLALSEHGIPFFVEKPPVAVGYAEAFARLVNDMRGFPCAVGYCYRFHPVLDSLGDAREMSFDAWDDLVGRYGPTVVETMGSHAIDLALWRLGDAVRVQLHSDGLTLRGSVNHERGASHYHIRIDQGPRYSRLNDRLLYPDDGMYEKELAAWLNWVFTGGAPDHRLCTLGEGLLGVQVMEQVQALEAVA